MYLVQLSKSGKYASGKKVAQNTSEYCNLARNILHFNNLALGASTLLRINVFSATFLPEAYLPDFDSCTKYIDFQQRWSTGGIVEVGASVLPDWSCCLSLSCRWPPDRQVCHYHALYIMKGQPTSADCVKRARKVKSDENSLCNVNVPCWWDFDNSKKWSNFWHNLGSRTKYIYIYSIWCMKVFCK